MFAGEFDKALPAAREALAEGRQVDDQRTVARSLYVLGNVMMFGDPAGCRQLLAQARGLAAASGDEYCRAMATVMLANSFLHLGDHRRAEPLAEEAFGLGEDLDLEEVRSWCWGARAWIGMSRGDLDGCRAAARAAIAAARTVSDVVSEMWATALLAMADIGSGRPDAGLDRITGLRERAVALGAGFVLVLVEVVIGFAHLVAGRLRDAQIRLQAIIDRDGDGSVHALVGAHFFLTEAVRLQGDTGRAEDIGRQGLALAEQKGSQVFAAMMRLSLGRVAGQRGDWAQAQQLLHEGLTMILDNDYGPDRLQFALDGLAEVAAALDGHVEAARILGASMRMRDEVGIVDWPSHRAEDEAVCDRVRAALGVEAFERTVAEGRALSTEEAVAYVRRARGTRNRPQTGWESLTPTERGVVRYAADGLTNPEIAARMFISRGTVKIHLSHVYAKLGIKNRSELAAAAARRAPST